MAYATLHSETGILQHQFVLADVTDPDPSIPARQDPDTVDIPFFTVTPARRLVSFSPRLLTSGPYRPDGKIRKRFRFFRFRLVIGIFIFLFFKDLCENRFLEGFNVGAFLKRSACFFFKLCPFISIISGVKQRFLS